ncbi:DNA-binding FadR family transcriptional regulator [Streptomyces aurantiacus]|uniref:GntR family transcriptional regulator n=1 Tax=Streptomyces aurantiacus TaxID=47760 RepID=UPI00278CC2AC|nr:GntR family transcriptional regulator [Streptomyces aurantiacus]MDQ0773016.1 DNA-binding FadR family transcriptional regulator [Streptomyces aurantiacus]
MDAPVELPPEETRRLGPKEAGQANRVYRGLREAITTGAIPPRVLLPATDLTSDYKVSRHVVAAALRGLSRDGLVHVHHLGARVVDVPEPGCHPVPLPAATPGERVEREIRRRLADGTYRPGSLLPRQRILAEEFGIPLYAVRSTLESLYQEGYLINSVKPKGTLVTTDVAEAGRDELLHAASGRPCPLVHAESYAAFGQAQSLHDWSVDPRCAVAYLVLHRRVVKSGWAFEKALTTPLVP